MKLADVDITPFQGLIFCTAVRYADFLDDDLDDVQQALALKVAQAIRLFDPARSRIPGAVDDKLRSFVNSCLQNRVKDMLKEQSRRNARRKGGPIFIEDAARDSRFEGRYFAESEESAYFEVEDELVKVPSTLTEIEVRVLTFLLLDFNQTEIAAELGLTRQRVRSTHLSIQEKMADWRPTGSDDKEPDDQPPPAPTPLRPPAPPPPVELPEAA